MAKPFEYVTKRWINQVRTNEKQFNESLTRLSKYEQVLVKSLDSIHQIEQQSTKVKDTYHENIKELNNVATQQTLLLYELDSIEKSLDQYLPDLNSSSSAPFPSTENKILKQTLRDPSVYGNMPSREQVLE
jgi:chromosome segregation ATPase